jgi:steroid delta-isomerase-like uncharacterized protein
VEFLRAFGAAFPDFVFTPTDEIAEGQKVVVRWTFTGTHRGEFMGVPASGRVVTLTGIDILEVSNGRIIEGWVEANVIGLLRQVGALPT